MLDPNEGKEDEDSYELPDDIQETMEDLKEDQDWLDEIRHDLFD